MGATSGKREGIISRLFKAPFFALQEARMKLSRHEVESIAHLARLEISPDEIPAYVDNLSRIIDFVQQLERADTEGVTPMAHPLNMSQPLRDDAVTEADQRALYQQNAQAVESGLYLVPRVIE
jgi:aspartyl-tRNA(Asn)/glutamyl-tRNA(Gln) amidotransferase subunit C